MLLLLFRFWFIVVHFLFIYFFLFVSYSIFFLLFIVLQRLRAPVTSAHSRSTPRHDVRLCICISVVVYLYICICSCVNVSAALSEFVCLLFRFFHSVLFTPSCLLSRSLTLYSSFIYLLCSHFLGWSIRLIRNTLATRTATCNSNQTIARSLLKTLF